MSRIEYSVNNQYGFPDPTASKAVWHADRAQERKRRKPKAASFDLHLTYSFDGRPSHASNSSEKDLRNDIRRAQGEIENLKSLLHKGVITRIEFDQQKPALVANYHLARQKAKLQKQK